MKRRMVLTLFALTVTLSAQEQIEWVNPYDCPRECPRTRIFSKGILVTSKRLTDAELVALEKARNDFEAATNHWNDLQEKVAKAHGMKNTGTDGGDLNKGTHYECDYQFSIQNQDGTIKLYKLCSGQSGRTENWHK